ncbi:MAG: DUF1643 domain-containing protein [Cyanobium sp.]
MDQPEPGGEAAFSRCGQYRWWLRRRWQASGPRLLFVGLNPSSADGCRDDPTLRRLIGFARSWGYGSLEVLNLFAWISSDPTALRQCRDPVGDRTDAWIVARTRVLTEEKARDRAVPPTEGNGGVPLWLGWGNGGGWRGRDQQLLEKLQGLPVRLLCLGVTAGGHPRHPLYVRGGSPLMPFAPSLGQRFTPQATPCPARRAATRST